MYAVKSKNSVEMIKLLMETEKVPVEYNTTNKVYIIIWCFYITFNIIVRFITCVSNST